MKTGPYTTTPMDLEAEEVPWRLHRQALQNSVKDFLRAKDRRETKAWLGILAATISICTFFSLPEYNLLVAGLWATTAAGHIGLATLWNKDVQAAWEQFKRTCNAMGHPLSIDDEKIYRKDKKKLTKIASDYADECNQKINDIEKNYQTRAQERAKAFEKQLAGASLSETVAKPGQEKNDILLENPQETAAPSMPNRPSFRRKA